MNIGTKISGTLISDDRFLKNCANLETLASVKKDSLITGLYNTGIEIYKLYDERKLSFEGDEQSNQIRQDFDLILTKKMSKNDIYKIINNVQSQPLKITNNYYK